VVLVWHLVLATLLSAFASPERVPGLLTGIGSAGVLAYMALGWGLWGSSLGKAALGLRIVPAAGGRMTLGRGVWRVLCYLLASFPAKLGLAAALWDRERRGWHDHLAGTIVVREGGERPGTIWVEPAAPPAGAGSRARWRWGAAALGIYLVMVLVFTWPLAAHFATRLPGGDILGLSEDSYVFLWDYWWVKKAWSEGWPVMSTDYLFWPQRVSLRFHTLMPQNSALAAPLQGPLGLVATYNLLLLASLVGNAWAAYGLVMMVTGRPGAALVAGGLFAGCPYLMTHALAHPNLVAVQWMPVLAWLLVKGIRSGRWQWGVGAGAALGALGYCDWYGFLYGGMLAVLVAAGHLVVREQRRGALVTLAVTSLVGAAVAAPLLVPMLGEQAAQGYAGRSLLRSSSLAGDPVLWLIPSFLATWAGPVGERVVRSMHYLVAEHTVYLGWGVVALALVGWRARRREMVPWAVAASGLLLLSLGPYLHLAGREEFPGWLVLVLGGLPGNGFDLPVSSGAAGRLALCLLAGGGQALALGERVWLPYGWLWQWIPGLKTASVPVRMALPAMLCLAVMAGAGLAHLWGRGGRARLLGGALAVLTVVDFLPLPYPTRSAAVPARYHQLAGEPGDFAILEVPLSGDLGVFMYYQTVHEKKILAGLLSRPPGQAFSYIRSNTLLRDLLWQAEPGQGSHRLPLTDQVGQLGPAATRERYGAGLRSLRRERVRYLILHPGLLSTSDAAAVEVTMGRLGISPVHREQSLVVYRLAGEPGGR